MNVNCRMQRVQSVPGLLATIVGHLYGNPKQVFHLHTQCIVALPSYHNRISFVGVIG